VSRAELPIVAVVGATATGKSEVAVALARALDGEIVGADSRQVYQGMAIGTAQPTPAQLAAVPHHLIGFLPPDARFSLGEYLERARTVIAAIRARGRLPIVAGGTGQYVWALLEGWEVPRVPPDDALRDALHAYAREHGPEALYQRLREADPDAAAFIDPRNVRRVARALEVIAATGRPFSAQRRRGPAERAIVIGLRLPYAQLDARIDRRVEEMYRAGFLDEVRALEGAGYGPDLPSMRSIGYPEAWKALRGETSVANAIAATQMATRRLARRQGAWFRAGDPRIVWLDADDVVPGRATAAVEQRLTNAAEETS
jgi:tRNA dimethylallyltransferase